MPDVRVRFSWDLELADVDNDYDLDVLVSCKRCAGSYLFRNDGAGTFTDDPRGLPQYTNNYEFEPMDLDGDGFLDLVTINDGEIVGEQQLEPARARLPQRRQGPLPRCHDAVVAARRTTSAKTTTWSRFSTSTPTATPTSSSAR